MSLFKLLAGPSDLPKKVSRVIRDEDIDVNDCWEDGYLPLMVAAQNGLVNSACKLMGLGADVNAVADDGDTALMEAADENHCEIVSLLIEAGADMNMTDEGGLTALMYACTAGNIEAASVLIKAGADFRIADQDGKTALDMAVENKHWDVAEALSDLGVKSGAARPTQDEKEDRDEDSDSDDDDEEEDESEEEEAVSSDEESEDDPEETWLTPILSKAGIPEHMMYHAEEMLVRQEGIGSEKTLAHLSPTLFHRAYLEGLEIMGLGLQQVLLDLHDDLHREFLKKRRADNLRDMRAQQQTALPPAARGAAPLNRASFNAPVRKATVPPILQRSPPLAAVSPPTAVRVPASFNGPKTDLQILYDTASAPLVEKAPDQPSHIATTTSTAVHAPLTDETTEVGKKRPHTTAAEGESASEDSASKRAPLPSPVHPVVRYTLEEIGQKCLPTAHAPTTDAGTSDTLTMVKAETVATRATDASKAATQLTTAAQLVAAVRKAAEKEAAETALLASDSGSDCCSDAEYVVAKDFLDDDDDKMIASG